MRLLSYNIRFGGVGRVEALAAVIEASRADLVLLQEATRPEVVERLAKTLGMAAWASDPRRSAAFISRMRVAEHRWHLTPPSRRAFLELALADTSLRVFNVHLSAVHSNWTERLRALELRAVLEGVKRRQHGFHLVAGDFNTLAPGATLELAQLPRRLRLVVWLTGRRLRWRTIQMMLDAGYVDAYRALHPERAGFTFTATRPHVRLDYLFVPSAWKGRLAGCEVFEGTPAVREASDHLPLVAEI